MDVGQVRQAIPVPGPVQSGDLDLQTEEGEIFFAEAVRPASMRAGGAPQLQFAAQRELAGRGPSIRHYLYSAAFFRRGLVFVPGLRVGRRRANVAGGVKHLITPTPRARGFRPAMRGVCR
jgi:hypothetical protein